MMKPLMAMEMILITSIIAAGIVGISLFFN